MELFKSKRVMFKTNELEEPLLSKQSDVTEASSAYSYSNHDEITPKPTTGQLLTAAAVASCVTAGAASSIASFIMYPAVIVYIAGGICLFNCPIVIYNQRKMMVSTALRTIVNKLRQQIDLLDKAIEDTQKEIDDLKIIQTRFGGVEDEFEEFATTQNVNKEEIISLVKENEDILDLMRENLRQRIIQDVIGAVVRSDRDGDQKFGRVEAKILALKIKVKLEVYGIYFDEEKFLQAIALKPSFAGAIAVVQKLLPMEYQDGNYFDEERFRSYSSLRYDDDDSLDEDDIYDMFYMSKGEQEQRESVLAVRAVFGTTPEQRISLASSRGRRRSTALVRSRLASNDDVLSGGGNLFPIPEK